MAIKRHKRGNRVYLAEYKSIRQGKKVISKFVRYIGPEDKLSTTEKTRKRVLEEVNVSGYMRVGGLVGFLCIIYYYTIVEQITKL